MTPDTAIDLGRNALLTAALVSAPILLIGLVVSLLIGLAQALTQIQDQTVAFVPKLAAILVALAFCLPWVLQQLVEYSRDLIENAPKVVRGLD